MRSNRVTAFSAAVLTNILCLWLLQYGVRMPARQPLPVRETQVELIPLPQPAHRPEASAQPATIRTLPHPQVQPSAITANSPTLRTDTPTPVASAPAHKLDMEALRNGARQVGDQGKNEADSAIRLNLQPIQAAAPSALSQEMSKAQRSGCGSAYADMGLLAPLALLHDAATGKGCSWQQ
ncbi:hypothetical protein HNQ50_003979 [Silvimonas terrae]|uniref:Uncharacterized protein n=1 Tax=Silvimonas terrae TaxID=300266 RepID=A0A840RIT9_9NEIS|nr:hypothetical protein [Silvimonas terrae]MBB5193225.1 hypothetical protein [Silvimonas terrae]